MNADLTLFIQKISIQDKWWGICYKLDGYKSIEAYWIALHVNGNNVKYFVSFCAELIPKEILKIHRQQKYHNNTVYRIQAYD